MGCYGYCGVLSGTMAAVAKSDDPYSDCWVEGSTAHLRLALSLKQALPKEVFINKIDLSVYSQDFHTRNFSRLRGGPSGHISADEDEGEGGYLDVCCPK